MQFPTTRPRTSLPLTKHQEQLTGDFWGTRVLSVPRFPHVHTRNEKSPPSTETREDLNSCGAVVTGVQTAVVLTYFTLAGGWNKAVFDLPNP